MSAARRQTTVDTTAHVRPRCSCALAAAVATATLVLTACGADDASTTSTDTGTAATTTIATTTSPSTTSLAPATPDIAVWPQPNVVFSTPEEAATELMSRVFGITPRLGDFQQGDARSGEIPVFSPGDGTGADGVQRGTLLLRQLGQRNGWFVIGGVSEGVSIESPTAGATVPAGELTVSGRGRGFEGQIAVAAYRPGDATPLAQGTTIAGSAEDAEPYSVTLDLSAAAPGEVVALVVHGGVGLEEDPGELALIPVVIG